MILTRRELVTLIVCVLVLGACTWAMMWAFGHWWPIVVVVGGAAISVVAGMVNS